MDNKMILKAAQSYLMPLIRHELEMTDSLTSIECVQRARSRSLLLFSVAVALISLISNGVCALPAVIVAVFIFYFRWLNADSLRARSESILFKAAQNDPDTPIPELVREMTTSDTVYSKLRGVSILILVFCALFGGAILMEVFGGVYVVDMVTGVFEGDTSPDRDYSVYDYRSDSLTVMVPQAPEKEHQFEPVSGGFMLVKCGVGYQSAEKIIIPSVWKDRPVVAIGPDAFASHLLNLRTVEIPATVVRIGDRAFYGCSLEAVFLPDSVTSMGSGVFRQCTALTQVRIGAGLTELPPDTFKGCTALKGIFIPENITAIRGNCFEDCTGLQHVIWHDGISAIHGHAFRNCSSLERITLPAAITEVRGNTFENCVKLKAIRIPEGVTRIGGYAFYGCGRLSQVYLPDSVMELGSSAFRKCKALRHIKVPRDTSVDQRTFKESPTWVVRK